MLEYLPTFGSYMGQMLVNIPYMEHMGLFEQFQNMTDVQHLVVEKIEA